MNPSSTHCNQGTEFVKALGTQSAQIWAPDLDFCSESSSGRTSKIHTCLLTPEGTKSKD